MIIPESPTETELKNHLREATQIIAICGSALGMRADKDSKAIAGMLVEAMGHIQEAVTKFSELRN